MMSFAALQTQASFAAVAKPMLNLQQRTFSTLTLFSRTFSTLTVESFHDYGWHFGPFAFILFHEYKRPHNLRIPPSLPNEMRFHGNSEKSEREVLEHSGQLHSKNRTCSNTRFTTGAERKVVRCCWSSIVSASACMMSAARANVRSA